MKGIFKNIFNKTKNDNKESDAKPLSLEGLGTRNSIIVGINESLGNRFREWIHRYSREEFPKKLIINSIYQSLQLECLCNNLDYFFKGKKYDKIEEALKEVETFKNRFLVDIHSKVDVYYESNINVGSLDIKKNKMLINDILNDDDKAKLKLMNTYLWYSGAFELGVYYCALGLLGFNKKGALDNLLDVVIDLDMSDLINAQMLFGNNISLLFYTEKLYDNEFKFERVKKYVKDICNDIEQLTGLHVYKQETTKPPLFSKIEKENIEGTETFVADELESPYVSYKLFNRFQFNALDLPKEIFLCVISIEMNDGFLIRPNGETFIEHLDFDEILVKLLKRKVGTFGGYSENGKSYKEYSWIVIE